MVTEYRLTDQEKKVVALIINNLQLAKGLFDTLNGKFEELMQEVIQRIGLDPGTEGELDTERWVLSVTTEDKTDGN